MGKIIRGSKGPPAPREPVRAEDTLNSKEFATIQDLLSEGEIKVLQLHLKKILLVIMQIIIMLV